MPELAAALELSAAARRCTGLIGVLSFCKSRELLRLAGELLGLGGDTKACATAAAAAATAVAVGRIGIGVAYSVGPPSDEEAAPVPGVIKGIVLCGVTGDGAIGVVGAWLASIASALRFNSTLLGLPRFRVSMSMISGSSAAAAAGAAAPPSGPGPPGAGAAAGR